FGARLRETPRDMLFYSGGGGSVRGQPYQSLGVFVLRADQKSGGRSFFATSGEVRLDVTEAIGLVGFVDAGFVSPDEFLSEGDWHSGAGLGLRYATPIGPIRLDVAAPVSGTTGEGVQIYVGIGQAF
ncbi:MAG: BamA/TamA family outer membrane protein, partial [Rhodobacteraceae bacterium]|nr:BamA/TamA family outer membrane protein [Paracoccaceae bacterium]